MAGDFGHMILQFVFVEIFYHIVFPCFIFLVIKMASSLKIVRIATKRPSASCWNSSELARLRPKDLHVRSQSTSTKLSEESDRETVRKPQPASFVMGMFSGQTVLRQVLPFPDVLDDDQLETINMMRDSNLKFFTEVNDSLENDEKGEVKAESYRMLAGKNNLPID